MSKESNIKLLEARMKGDGKMRGLFKKVYEELNSKNNYGH